MANNIIPFLWVRSESTEDIEKAIDEIYSYGLTAFCVESRPFYPERVEKGKPKCDFNSESWFNRLDCILEYAETKKMQVWCFDDMGFPSGVANRKYEEYPELLPRQIVCDFTDFVSNGEMLSLLTPFADKKTDKLLDLIVYKMEDGVCDIDNCFEFIVAANAEIVSLTIPKGVYRAAFLMESSRFSEFPYYMDVLSEKSIDLYVDELYEKHFSRYNKYYGKTFVGFFSDEPRFGNGYYNAKEPNIHNVFENILGLSDGAYPISDEVKDWLSVKGFPPKYFLSLFCDCGEKTGEFRCCYADKITDLYSKNYSKRLADWCHLHGISYTAHIIEDMGGHCRFGCGTGNYFKAMDGLDYAGIDVVLHSIKPYIYDRNYLSPVGICNSDFYLHTLGRLACSSASLDAGKAGKAICEIFGAYGYGETIGQMLYLVNHFLACGINYFIPHAFTMDYCDEDCPPHFYMNERVLQYRGYKLLFEYMNKMCRELSGGERRPRIAVLYHAEAEWSGKPFDSIDSIAKELDEHQIDFDFIPSYKLKFAERYKALVIPYAEYYPQEVMSAISGVNIPIIKIGSDTTVNSLSAYLFDNDYVENIFQTQTSNLRAYQYYKNDKRIYLLFNCSNEVLSNGIAVYGEYLLFDYINGKNYQPVIENSFSVFNLNPGECLLLKEGKATPIENYNVYAEIDKFEILQRDFDKADFVRYKGFCNDFSGCLKYSFDYALNGIDKIKVEYSGEFCSVKIGDEYFDSIGDGEFEIKSNEKHIEITVSNTIASAVKDRFSRYSALYSCKVDKVILYKKI